MGGRASIGTSWTSAVSSRFSRSLKSCVRRLLRRSALHNFVLRFLESLERTRLSGRSAASWERTAEELMSRWAALLTEMIAARQHNSFGDLWLWSWRLGNIASAQPLGARSLCWCPRQHAVVFQLDNCRRRKERTSPTVSFVVIGSCSTRWWMSWSDCSLHSARVWNLARQCFHDRVLNCLQYRVWCRSMDVQCGDYRLCELFYTLSECKKGIHWSINDTGIMGMGLGAFLFFWTLLFFFRSLALVFQKSPTRNKEATGFTLRNPKSMEVPLCSTLAQLSSFLPSCSILWNTLPASVTSCSSLSSFASSLDSFFVDDKFSFGLPP